MSGRNLRNTSSLALQSPNRSSSFSHNIKFSALSVFCKTNLQISTSTHPKMVHIDYFSFLPDPIIHMIISHLPFKEAARTSILSTRWRHLWHSTTNIDLDETLFVRNQQSSVARSMQRLNFLNFVDRWMGNYAEPYVDKYRIKISNPAEALRQVQTCITFAINHREIKALDLDFSDPTWDAFNLDLLPHQPSLDLPVILDSHTMLESLHLSACTTFRVPHQDRRFDSLKALYLGWMEMRGHSINRFVKLCPSLEALIIKRCWGVEDLNIESQSLRFLAIDKCLGIGKITVKKTPLLKYFQYYGLSVSLEMEDMPTMEQAVFDYTHDENWSDGDADMLREILCKISSVWALSICSYVLQVLPLVPSPLWLTPSLPSVTHLFLKTKLHIQEYYGISLFLNSCPKLEFLSIDLGPQPIFEEYEPPYSYDEHPFYNPLWYPTCLVDTLKAVKVKGFKGKENERIVLSYLLKYGKVLDYLDITLSNKKINNDGVYLEPIYKSNVVQLMLGTEIASPNLKLIVRSY